MFQFFHDPLQHLHKMRTKTAGDSRRREKMSQQFTPAVNVGASQCVTHMKIIKPYQRGLAVDVGFWWGRCSQGTWPVSQYVLLYCTSTAWIFVINWAILCTTCSSRISRCCCIQFYVVTYGFFEPSLTVGKSEVKYLFCCRTKKKKKKEIVRFCFGICDLFYFFFPVCCVLFLWSQ